jgi:hypothetical protein
LNTTVAKSGSESAVRIRRQISTPRPGRRVSIHERTLDEILRIAVGRADGMGKGCLNKSKTDENEQLSETESHPVSREAHQ